MGLPIKKSGLHENLTGAELFIYDESGAQLSVLNASALFIWSMCDGEHDAARMQQVLSDIYPDSAPDQLRDDIDGCLASLRDKGLIVKRAEQSKGMRSSKA